MRVCRNWKPSLSQEQVPKGVEVRVLLPEHMKEKPKYWVSLKTGNKYPYYEYINHGWGGERHGKKDLPKEYPYTIEYEESEIPLWMK